VRDALKARHDYAEFEEGRILARHLKFAHGFKSIRPGLLKEGSGTDKAHRVIHSQAHGSAS
jgi:hypothetical protein